MCKGKPKSGKKDARLENVKEVIVDEETFTVEHSTEILDATFITNEVNKIQKDVQPIAQLIMTGDNQGVVEDVTGGLSAPTNMHSRSTQKKYCFLQGALYFL